MTNDEVIEMQAEDDRKVQRIGNLFITLKYYEEQVAKAERILEKRKTDLRHTKVKLELITKNYRNDLK